MLKPQKKYKSSSVTEERRLPDTYYAKTRQLENGTIVPGRTVYEHCRIVGEVARALICRIGDAVPYRMFPPGSELTAAAHDVGKVSPTFQKKILQATTGWQPEDEPALKTVNPGLESQWGGHAGVSQLALEAVGAGKFIPEICGQHHGYTPPVELYRAAGEQFGGPAWQREREKLLEMLRRDLAVDWPSIDAPESARIVAGLTAVADWIGSGSLFDDPEKEWRERVAQALDQAGFIWPQVRQGLSFQEVFSFPGDPYPVQQQFVEMVTEPGVYVLEAPMGMGKTEAALYAAYRLLNQRQALGIYFALPTRLTSNRIHSRFNTFLKKILQPDAVHHRALLLHGKAWLQATELGAEGGPGNSWFDSRKRGLLAPFAVGTLDQALMAAMNVKHGFVRAFGLAGKVVILDEVHSYDAYTGTIIDALIKLLRKLDCTVIILSATLTHERRRELLGTEVCNSGFPLVTAVPAAGRVREKAAPAPAGNRVELLFSSDTAAAVAAALESAEAGSYVLWIENTVAEAQERFLDLAARAAEIGIECGLLHSRFTPRDRELIEARWVSRFGKEGWAERGDCNRSGRILIGTQVLEQSLDIDADCLITRFCPTDMLFQRLGRLWRHAATPRPEGTACRAFVLAPDLEEAVASPRSAFGATAWVYAPYVLCRSLEAWQRRDSLLMPDEIRLLMEETYRKRMESGNWAKWFHELENGDGRFVTGRRALRQLARITLASGAVTLPEEKAQTRYGEEPLAEVLLLRRIVFEPDRQVTSLFLLDGRCLELPWKRSRLNREAWRRLSAELAGQVLAVRRHQAPAPLSLQTLRKLCLHYCFYLGRPEHDENRLRLAEVDGTGCLRGFQGAELQEKYDLFYREDTGYRVLPKDMREGELGYE
jgi:CRISPR-associated endonuclease/helicase Cas3